MLISVYASLAFFCIAGVSAQGQLQCGDFNPANCPVIPGNVCPEGEVPALSTFEGGDKCCMACNTQPPPPEPEAPAPASAPVRASPVRRPQPPRIAQVSPEPLKEEPEEPAPPATVELPTFGQDATDSLNLDDPTQDSSGVALTSFLGLSLVLTVFAF